MFGWVCPARALTKPECASADAKGKNAEEANEKTWRYIVADPAICHGTPTFRGTHIMISQVLRQVARGSPWEEISAEWRGKVNEKAITEAIELWQ